MRGKELLVAGGLTCLLLLALAITVPVEQHNRSNSTTTSPPQVTDGRALRYYILGDYGELNQSAVSQPIQIVAQHMSNLSLTDPIDFLVTTGDNIYSSDMKDLFDLRHYDLMYSVFNTHGLSGKPWLPVYGSQNCGNPQSVWQASEAYPMWNMPGAYYNMTLELDGNQTVAMVFLDGCTLSCERIGTEALPSFCEAYDYTESAIEKQYQWLASVLEDAQSANWILVHTYIPPFSAGSGDNEALKVHLLPLLQTNQVDVLFTGHEQLMQYFYIPEYQPYVSVPSSHYNCTSNPSYLQFSPQDYVTLKKGSGLQEVVVGSSGHPVDQLCPDRVTEMAELVFGSTTFGFAQVEVASARVTVTYYSAEGSQAEALFTVTLTP